MILVNFIIVLGILIFVHELGHFLVAKWMGVRVEKFSLGFGPKLIGRQIGETEYLLSAFPLGGYVKMFGEGGFSEIELIEQEYERDGAKDKGMVPYSLPDHEKERSFAHKSIPQRMAIVFAGPLFNMVFAWLLLVSIYLTGVPLLDARIGEVLADRPAAVAGIQKGDLITAVNGQSVRDWDGFSKLVGQAGGPVTITITRSAQSISFTMTPTTTTTKNLFGESVKKPVIGVSPSYQYTTTRYGLFEAIQAGNAKAVEVTSLTFLSLVKLVEGVVPLNSLGGPMMIADMANKAAKTGGASFMMLLAVVSINLGILNLMPIPVLDGGHLLFYSIEAIIRRPVPQKVREYAQQAGMLVLIAMMVLAFYNDIMRYFINTKL
ncbi:MAG: RIP metalloprotease RseP [Trichlorobacter sp.]